MKRNFLYSVMALFVVLFASCSQNEVPTSGNSDGHMNLTVNVSGVTPSGRADVSVSNYTMRCIMEVLDADGNPLTIEEANATQMSVNVDTSTGKATFNFTKPEGAAKYLFWADYLNSGGQSFYTTNNGLQAITYRLNKITELFNNTAADAFCACVDDNTLGANITLKRPFTRIAVKTADLESLGLTGLDKITPNIYCGAGFNVATGKAETQGQIRVDTASDPTAFVTVGSGEFAFFCYVLATVADETRGSTIKFYSDTDTEGKTVNITADQMKELNGNTNVNLKPSEEQPEDNKVNVDIVIDNNYEDSTTPTEPEEPTTGEYTVGSYINAAGAVTTDASQAVAVIFSLAEASDNSNYGENKTVKAYAIALNKIGNTRAAIGDLSSFSLEATNDDNNAYAGYAFSEALKSKLSNVTAEQSALFNTYYSASLPSLTGTNLSDWYIPSKAQLDAAVKVNNATLTENLKNAYTSDYYLATSSVGNSNGSNSIYGSIYSITNGTISKTDIPKSTTSAHIFPVLTIFE